jgi:hypothetical protein
VIAQSGVLIDFQWDLKRVVGYPNSTGRKCWCPSASAWTTIAFAMRLIACLLSLNSLLQVGAALPHSHLGSGIDEPAGHLLRPHIHLSGEPHRYEPHVVSSRPLPLPEAKGVTDCYEHPLCDHDHDAVYLNGTSTLSVGGCSSGGSTLSGNFVAIIDDCAGISSVSYRAGSPARYLQRVPIFLASTRLLV